jgi:photosystem II stability/assembly factor-like uncharacterized protein
MENHATHAYQSCERHLRALMLVLLVFAIWPAAVSAKTDVWSKLGLSGQRITALATDPQRSGTIYAGSSTGALFKTTDGGRTWIGQDLAPGSNIVNAIAVDRRNTNTLYAATYLGLIKSTDGGDHWTVVNSDLVGCRALALDPRDPDKIYAGTDHGVFKSTDAGLNWAHTLLNESVHSLVIDPLNTELLYAGTILGIAKSTNGGASWMSYPWTDGPVRALAIDPMTPNTLYAGTTVTGGIFKSTDSGVTWVSSGLSSNPVYALVVDVMQTSTLYAATENGAFKSVDAARSWSAINDGLIYRRITALSSDPAICKVYAGNEDGVFETDIGPVLTLHAEPCIGGPWSLAVSHAIPNTSIRLLGVSNDVFWEIAPWSTTDEAGGFSTSGTFPVGSEGHHQLRTDIGGLPSNIVSFVIRNCQ